MKEKFSVAKVDKLIKNIQLETICSRGPKISSTWREGLLGIGHLVLRWHHNPVQAKPLAITVQDPSQTVSRQNHHPTRRRTQVTQTTQRQNKGTMSRQDHHTQQRQDNHPRTVPTVPVCRQNHRWHQCRKKVTTLTTLTTVYPRKVTSHAVPASRQNPQWIVMAVG